MTRCVALQGFEWTLDNVVFVDMLLLVQPRNLGRYLAQLRQTTFRPQNLISGIEFDIGVDFIGNNHSGLLFSRRLEFGKGHFQKTQGPKSRIW